MAPAAARSGRRAKGRWVPWRPAARPLGPHVGAGAPEGEASVSPACAAPLKEENVFQGHRAPAGPLAPCPTSGSPSPGDEACLTRSPGSVLEPQGQRPAAGLRGQPAAHRGRAPAWVPLPRLLPALSPPPRAVPAPPRGTGPRAQTPPPASLAVRCRWASGRGWEWPPGSGWGPWPRGVPVTRVLVPGSLLLTFRPLNRVSCRAELTSLLIK